jgi:hypothetical protein
LLLLPSPPRRMELVLLGCGEWNSAALLLAWLP